MADPRARALRRGTLIQGAITAAFMIAIAVIATHVDKAPPPHLLEFAPHVPAQLKPPRTGTLPDRNATCSSGETCAEGGPTKPSPTPAAEAVVDAALGAPRALQCYTWPDGSVTQTFDPQSPPCVAGWPEVKQGNGGTTSQGVSATEVRVAVPALKGKGQSPFDYGIQAFADFVNQRYQLWGRRITLVRYDASGVRTQEEQHAVGLELAKRNVFAATSLTFNDQDAYRETLAQHRIISMSAESDMVRDATLDRLAPYAWSSFPTLDTIERNLALFSCRTLAGHPASHATSTGLRSQQRKFGIVVASDQPPTPDVTILKNTLAACGNPAQVFTYDYVDSTANRTTTTAAQLRSSGVTTVLAVGVVPQALMDAANVQRYQPEWVGAGTVAQYTTDGDWSSWAGENRGLFGLVPGNPWTAAAQRTSFQVLNATGYPTPKTMGSLAVDRAYRNISLIAAGIQAAGPHLTAQTFEKGLQSLVFPNPGSGKAPIYQATVGFHAGSHAMYEDFALFYWSSRATGNYGGNSVTSVGGWCYAGRGQRWSEERWPRQEPGLFNEAKGC